MRLALWNTPATELLVYCIRAALPGVEITVADAATCEQALRQAAADAALLPTLSVLLRPDEFAAMPISAYATWDNPFVRVLLRQGLTQPVRTLAFHPADAQEAFVARVILGEHYGADVQMVAVERHADLHTAGADALLLTGSTVPVPADGLVLDLGQEWYELASYPMVWGLFAVRQGDADAPALAPVLRRAVQLAEDERSAWIAACETTPALHAFYAEALRFRFDDLATASLTELAEYLFYYKITPEPPDLPLVTLPETPPDAHEDPPLRL
jgi:predicted solute-binding protein